MSHHGREDEREDCTIGWHESNLNRYGSAVELIKAIANGHGEDGADGSFATTTPRQACDAWLERNGLECEASKRRQRELRAERLDAEIAKLRAEREAL